MHRTLLIPLLLILAGTLAIHADEEPQHRALTDKEVRALVGALDDPLTRVEALRLCEHVQPNPDLFDPIRKLCLAADIKVNYPAAAAIASFGERGVPTLIDMLGRHDTCRAAIAAIYPVREQAAAAAGPLVKLLEDPDPEVRKAAAGMLGWFGSKAEMAIPALMKLLADSDEQVREATSRALAQIGQRAVGPLTKALGDPNPIIREAAANGLGSAEKATAPLTKLLSDQDSGVRKAAAMAQWASTAKGDDAIEPLLKLLADSQDDIPWVACCALSRILENTEKPEIAIAPLIKLLSHKNAETRQFAAYTLASIGPRAEAAVGPLTRLLSDPAPQVREPAAQALWKIGKKNDAAVEPLIKLVVQSEQTSQGTQALALARVGGKDILTKLALDPSPERRLAAARALGKVGEHAEKATKHWIKELSSPDLDARQHALKVLDEIGEHVRPLFNQLADPNPQTRKRAADALTQIGEQADLVIGPLRKLLADSDPCVRQEAAFAFRLIGEKAEKAIEPLTAQLADPDPRVRSQAAEALGQAGYKAEKAIEGLCRLLRSEDRESRDAAASALGQIGDKAIEPLSKFVNDPNAFARQGAVNALTAIGTKAIFLSDPDPIARDKAANRNGMSGEMPLEVQVRLFTAQDPKTRQAAAEELRQIVEKVIGLLITFLKDPDPLTRATAATALGMAPAKRVVPALTQLLKDHDTFVTYCAARSLLELKDTRPIDMATFISLFRRPDLPADPTFSLLVRRNAKANPSELCQFLEIAQDKAAERSDRILDVYFVADNQNRPLVRWLGGRSDADLPTAAGLTHDQAADLLKRFTALLPHASDSPHVRKEIADRIVGLTNTASWSHPDLDALGAARDALLKSGMTTEAKAITTRVEALEQSEKAK